MSLHKPAEPHQNHSATSPRIEISPEPSDLERAVIEAAVHHHLNKSQEDESTPRSKYGATRLREFER